MVARQEREPLGDGMGYDDVVAGVAVVLRLVELELGVGKGNFRANEKRTGANALCVRSFSSMFDGNYFFNSEKLRVLPSVSMTFIR